MDATKCSLRFQRGYSNRNEVFTIISQDEYAVGRLGKDKGRRIPANGYMSRRLSVFGPNTQSGGPNMGLGSVRPVEG